MLAGESRLRGARLYTAEGFVSYLYLNVIVAGRAFSTSLDYKKTLIDPVSVEGGFATTWHRGSAGTHGGDAAYIVSNVSEHLVVRHVIIFG